MTQIEGEHLGQAQSGSLADLVSVPVPPPETLRLGPEQYAKIAILGLLFVGMNLWQLVDLWPRWLHDSNWQHGLLIPLFSLYLLYARRHELLLAPRRGCNLGLAIMLGALLMEVIGFYPLGIGYVYHLGMVLLLFGMVLYVAGPAVIKLTWLPILYWLFAMPLPAMVYNNIAFPLQNIAAEGSVAMLKLLGLSIAATGSSIDLVSISGIKQELAVVEACSGMRSLMAYLALGVALAWIEDRPVWQRIVLLLCIVPVAIFTNVIRVAITATMYYLDKPEFGKDFMHEVAGMVMLVPTLMILWLISYVLKRLYVEEEDAGDPGQPPTGEVAA